MTCKISTDVLIIGAGWSGLSAALRLSLAGKNVIVVEARERIGGRAFTHSWNEKTTLEDTARNIAGNTKSYTCDFGCTWMHGYHEGSPLKALTERYGIESNIPKPTKSLIIGSKGPLSLAIADKIDANLSAAQAASKDFARNKSSTPPQASESLASFLLGPKSPLFDGLAPEDQKSALALARSMHVPFGATLEQVGLRYYGFENNYAGTDAAPAGGFSKLIGKVADEAQSLGVEIRTGQVVDQILLKQDGSGVVVSTKALSQVNFDPITFEAKTIICTIPLAVLKEKVDIFEPSLPERRRATIARTFVGNLNKVLLSYDQAWWSCQVGTFMVLPVKEAASDPSQSSLEDLFACTTLIVNSLCAPNGFSDEEQGSKTTSVSNSLLVMIGADAGKAIEAHDRVQVGKQLHAYLSKRIEGGEGSEGPKHVFYSRWAKQEFTRGATTTPVLVGEHNSPLDFTELGRSLWQGRLGFAGEHTDADHHGSAAGAVVSGEREAQRLIIFLDKHHP